jgi:hypothetical protein
VEFIDESTIAKFVKEFNDDTLVLDDTMYSFQSEDIDSDDF